MWPLAILLGLTTLAVLAHRSTTPTTVTTSPGWSPIDPAALSAMGPGRYRVEALIAPVIGLPSSQSDVDSIATAMQSLGTMQILFAEEGPMPGTAAIFYYPQGTTRPPDWPPPQVPNEPLFRLDWQQKSGTVGPLPNNTIRAWKYVGS